MRCLRKIFNNETSFILCHWPTPERLKVREKCIQKCLLGLMIIHFKWHSVFSRCEELEVRAADSKVNQKVAEEDEKGERNDDSRPSFQRQLRLERRVLGDAVAKRGLGGRRQERYVVLGCVSCRRRWSHDDRWQRRLFRSQRKRQI